MDNEPKHSVEATPQAAATPLHADGNGNDLPIGAHLVTSRWSYEHHGIYVGDGMVVHYGGFFTGLSRRPVEQVSLAFFADGRPVRISIHARRRYSPMEVVARARSRLGENLYRLASNNCEHFCQWCLSGESRSEQIERLRAWPQDAIFASIRRLKAIVAGANAQHAASG
jgi:hypothetical protein